MTRLTRFTVMAPILFLLAAACEGAETLPVRVESLRDHLPALEDAARAWRSDAYLADASVPILDEQAGTLLLDAGFQSPSEQFESLLVRLMEDGAINTELVPHTVPVIQIEPITEDDWPVDSIEALEAGLNDEGIRYLEEHSQWNSSFLVLERSGRESGSPVVWRLVLTDWLDPWTSQEAIIDAMSGEILSREVHSPSTPMPVPTL